jgi:hypothetical protein
MMNGRVNHYGKGYGEESVALPFELQQSLAKITGPGTPLLKVKNPELVAFGAARYASPEEMTLMRQYRKAKNPDDQQEALRLLKERREDVSGRSAFAFMEEVNLKPVQLDGNFYPPTSDQKVPPQAMLFRNPDEAPDFTLPEAAWELSSDIYRGSVRAEVFSSKDRKLRYLFFRDGEGRAWIGGVQIAESPIRSTGLRSEWVSAGDLCTPAFEYKEQEGGYGKSRVFRGARGQYVDMFQNYLSKVPVIQEYLASVKARSAAPKESVPQAQEAVPPRVEEQTVAAKPELERRAPTPEKREQVRRISLTARLLERKALYLAEHIARLKALQAEANAGKLVTIPPSLKNLFDKREELAAFLSANEVKLGSRVLALDDAIPQTTADKIIDLFLKRLGSG